MIIVNEYGVYEAVFESRKKEAKEFKRWVFEMLKFI
ncbi:BRO family protein [Paenibacillus apis]|nr:BRO family protein [Paenibacillus apis]